MSPRPTMHLLPHDGGAERVAASAIVVGGGIAGVAAATVLAERGVTVRLIERERFLGGRAGAWSESLKDGSSFEMERGFHAFFRQYYNLRALMRRIDPDLALLMPLEDYPILGSEGQVQSFRGLPRRTPWNLLMLTARTPALGLRELRGVHVRRALEMLSYDAARTHENFDGMNAREYLDSLRFPPDARRLLFDVFAHSFFNPEQEMSAAELLMMFHFYFTGNPEGLLFDVLRRPFSHGLWTPFASYLRERGVELLLGAEVHALERLGEGSWRVRVEDEWLRSSAVVVATTVPALQSITRNSIGLEDASWRESIESLALTDSFAVWRLWLDRPVASGRAPFVGTTGLGPLDNISLYHLIEDESRIWAERSGGSVVELHAYAVPPGLREEELRAQLLEGLQLLYPETREAEILEDRFLSRRDCPAFGPGSGALRPGVESPFPGLALAGDFVKLPFPSALMERAAASGFLAANRLLQGWGGRPEPIYSIPQRGMLARFASRRKASA